MNDEFDMQSFRRKAWRKENENWQFRAFLKECDAGDDRIDRIVHRLYREEAEKFDCTACANCCRTESPLLDDEDVERLAGGLGLRADEVIARYLRRDDEYSDNGLVFAAAPCPLLKDNRCTCYPCRPHDCISFPHLHKDKFTHRLINMVANCSVCPIVFNVFERLKDEMMPYGWTRRRW